MEKPKNRVRWNTATVIAISFFLFSFFIFRMVLLHETKATEPTTASIIECIKGILFLIIGYYFGSSHKEKQHEKNNPDSEHP